MSHVVSSLTGAKGGSGGSSFKTKPDTLRSKDSFEILLGLGSGRWKGLTNGLKSLTINGVALENNDGSTNFEGFSVLFADGDPTQTQRVNFKLGGGGGSTTVNVPIANSWVTAAVTTPGADYIDLRFLISALYRQDKNSIGPTTMTLEIEMRPSGASDWVNPLSSNAPPIGYDPDSGIVIDDGYGGLVRFIAQKDFFAPGSGTGGRDYGQWNDSTPGYIKITDKTTSPAIKEIRIGVPNTGTYANKTWEVRVKMSEPALVQNDPIEERRTVTFESIAPIINKVWGADEAWRGLVWLQANGKASDQLNGFPSIRGIYDTKIVKVPPTAVFNPDTRAYTGTIWDGSYVLSYTNDPAWCLKDLIEDPVSGIAALSPGATLDKWDALEASKYYSQLVPDGKGGQHPRFSMNCRFDQGQNAEELIQYMAGAVNSLAVDEGNGKWRLKVDKPENPVAIFTLENIKGEFQYSHTDIDSRFNDYTCTFLNADNNYEEDRVRVFDQTHINTYGRKPTTVVAIGADSRQEALRRAMFRLRVSLNETRMVKFTTNRQGKLIQPLQTILVADTSLGYVAPTGSGALVDADTTDNRTSGRIFSKNRNELINSSGTGAVAGYLDARTNVIRNSSMQGGISGSPGIQPTNWSITDPPAGMTRTLTYGIDSEGFEYVDVRYNGTVASLSTLTLAMDTFTGITGFAVGDQVTYALDVQLIAGSYNGTSMRTRLQEANGGSALATQNGPTITPTNVMTRVYGSFVLAAPGVTAIRPRFDWNIPAGASDFTIRVRRPQAEKRAIPTDYIRTTNAAVTVNPTGVMPTYWTTSVTSGLLRQITPGVDINGVPYIDVRIAGTNLGPGSTQAIAFGATNDTIAAAGETWSMGFDAQLIAGSTTNISEFRWRLLENNAAGTNLSQNLGPLTSVSLLSTPRRLTHTATLSNVSTARVQAGLYVIVPSGSAVDFTIRLSRPQLEKSSAIGPYIETINGTRDAITLRDTVRLEPNVAYQIAVTIPNPAYNPDSITQPTSSDNNKPTLVYTFNVINTTAQRGDVNTLYLSTSLPNTVPANAPVALSAPGLPTLPVQYRVLEVTPSSGEEVQISALIVDSGKWAAMDNVSEDAINNQSTALKIDPPTAINFSVANFNTDYTNRRVLTVTWDRPGTLWLDGFKVEYRLNAGNWNLLQTLTTDTYVEIQDPSNGVYDFRIVAVDRRGPVSIPLEGTYTLTDRITDVRGPTTNSTIAARPAVPTYQGEIYRATDTGITYTGVNGVWVATESLGAPSGTNVAGMPATTVVQNINDILVDVSDLETTYGSTASAAASANAASTYAATAQAARDNANTYANNASTYANNASTSAGLAAGSATAASGSASIAGTSASNAGNSASAAQASQVSAQSVANRLLPDRPAVLADFTVLGQSVTAYTPDTIPDVFASLGTSATTPTVSGEGAVLQYTGGILLSTRGWYKIDTGKTFRGTWRFRRLAGTDGWQTGFLVYNASGQYLANAEPQIGRPSPVNTWVEVSSDITSAGAMAASASAVYVRPYLYVGNSDTQWQASYYSFRDVTSEANSAASAAAAASSASTAATQATAVGTSATAANTSATTASTASGSASTSAGQASTSATNAATSASAAASSATLSAGYAAVRGLTGNGDFELGDVLWNKTATTWGYQGSVLGSTYRTTTGSQGSIQYAGKIPVDPSRKYKLTAKYYLHNVSQTVYAGLNCFASDGTDLGIVYPNTNGFNGATMTAGQVLVLATITGTITPTPPVPTYSVSNAFPPNTAYVKPIFYGNYLAAATGITDIMEFYVEDVTESLNASSSATAAASSAASASGSAASASTSASLAAQFGQGALSKNPVFADWTIPYGSTLPVGWSNYSGYFDGNVSRNTVGLYGSPNGLVWSTANATTLYGLYQLIDPVATGWFVLEADVTWLSGSLNGAGLWVNWYNGGNSGTFLGTTTLPFYSHPTTNGTVANANKLWSWSKLIQAPANTTTIKFFAMQNYTPGDLGGGAVKVLTWHKAAIRPASQAEILAQTAIPTLQATQTTQAGVLTTLQGRALSYWQTTGGVTVGNSASYFITAQAEGSWGAGASSSVALGANEIHLYNSAATGSFSKALSVVGGNVLVYGDLNVGGAVRIGTRRIAVALQAFNVSGTDGNNISFGTDLVNIPKLEFQTSSLPVLTGGQAYDIKATNLTSTGFTMYAKIITPSSPTTVSQGPGTNVGGTPQWRMNKADAADSATGYYSFTVTAQKMFPGPSGQQVEGTLYVTVYARPVSTGVWTAIGTMQQAVVGSNPGGGSETISATWEESIYFANAIGQDGDYEFGVHPIMGSTVTAFNAVSYQKQSVSGGTTSVPQTVTVRVIPQNS